MYLTQKTFVKAKVNFVIKLKKLCLYAIMDIIGDCNIFAKLSLKLVAQ